MPKRDWQAVEKSPDYQRGFSDGFREGYSRAMEIYHDLIHRAVRHIPNQYRLVAQFLEEEFGDTGGSEVERDGKR